MPGRGDHKQDSLITRLRATRGASTTLAHRLDRDTSGLVVAAKTKRALRSLSMAFEAREVEKSYVGAVLGWPEATFGTVDEPIGKVKTDAGHNRVAVVAEVAPLQRAREHAQGAGRGVLALLGALDEELLSHWRSPTSPLS